MTNDKSKSWSHRLQSILGTIPKNKEELLTHLRMLQEHGGYWDKRSLEMIEGVLSMSEWQIRDVMIPKNDIIGLAVHDTYQHALKIVCDNAHSRYPVFDDDGERVIGVLLAKDLLRFANAPETFAIRDVMRRPIFEPPSKNLNAMLDDFRRHRTHMAIIIDEHEESVGILTIEDVLERIVGEIEDEFDDDDDRMQYKAADGKTVIKASMSVEEFNTLFNAQLPEDVDNIAGWLAAEIGYLPPKNYIHRSNGFIFRVLNADDRRIYTLKIERKD
ncbi:MAG: CBS domain-containing protein [Gammaproteobacteria bacterium WSBS_2016_MAG_OTU1]